MSYPGGCSLGAGSCVCVDASGWTPLQEREGQRGRKVNEALTSEAHIQGARKAQGKSRGLLYAQIQDSTEKEYALEIKKKNQTKTCSKILNPVFLLQNLLLAYL